MKLSGHPHSTDKGTFTRMSRFWPILWAASFLILLVSGFASFTAGIGLGFLLMFVGAGCSFLFMVTNIEAEFDFLRLLATAAAGFVSAGTLNNMIYTSFVVDQTWAQSLLTLEVTPRLMGFTGSLLIVYCGAMTLAARLFFHNPGLPVLGQLHGQLIQRVRAFSYHPGFLWFALLISFFICGLQVLALKTGLYAFRGMTAEDGVLSPVAVIIVTITPLAQFLAGMVIGKMRSTIMRGLPAISAALLVMAFQLLWALLGGRTGVVLAVITALVAVQIVNPVRRIGFGVVMAILLLGVVTKPLLDFYQFARFRDRSLMEVGKSDPVAFIKENWREYGQRGAQEKAEHNELIAENIANRGTVLSYFAQYLDFYSENNPSPLLGRCMINSFINCIPRAVYAGKVNNVLAENLYYQQQGFLPTIDGADSYYMEAFIDFHVLGYIVYPLVMALAVAVTLWCVAQFGGGIGSIVTFALIMRLMISSGGEGGQSGFYVMFRNILIIVVLLIPLDRLLKGNGAKAVATVTKGDARKRVVESANK